MRTRAVVSGGAGFLGSHLIDLLIGEGWDVTCLDNLSTGRRLNLRSHELLHFVEQDVGRPFNLHGEFEYVFHLADLASPVAYQSHPLQTLRGIYGTHNMLELARAKGARFLVTSTSEIYGSPQVFPQSEDYWGNVNPVGPRSMYAEGKRAAEAATMVYNRLGLETRIARPFNAYGPRLQPDDGRVIPNFMMRALRGEALVVYGDGSQTRSLCYVTDVVRGLYELALSDEDRPVNLGNPTEVAMRDLAQYVIDVTGSLSTIEYGPLPEDDPPRRLPDVSRALESLGWMPEVELEEGLERTAAAFRDALLAA